MDIQTITESISTRRSSFSVFFLHFLTCRESANSPRQRRNRSNVIVMAANSAERVFCEGQEHAGGNYWSLEIRQWYAVPTACTCHLLLSFFFFLFSFLPYFSFCIKRRPNRLPIEMKVFTAEESLRQYLGNLNPIDAIISLLVFLDTQLRAVIIILLNKLHSSFDYQAIS